jgi:hypothetical protein
MHGKPELSGTQLIASAAATMTATVAASYFGVAGTLIGAGAVSVLSTAGATLYQHFLDRGKAQIAGKMPARTPAGRPMTGVRAGGQRDGRVPAGAAAGGTIRRSWPAWYVLTGAAAGVFLVVMGVITAFELLTGRPLSNTVHGEAGRGTSVHRVTTRVHPRPQPPAPGEASTSPTPMTPSISPGRTPRATPTAYATDTAGPVPGQRSGSVEAPQAPVVTRSAAPRQPPPADHDGVAPGETP